MATYHHREHLFIPGGQIQFNSANYKSLAIRTWNQGGVADTFNLIGYFPKPFLHVRNMTQNAPSTLHLTNYWPITEAVYEGPNLLSPPYYNATSHLCTDPVGGRNVAASGALGKIGPLLSQRNGFYSYCLDSPNTLTILTFNGIRFGMTSVSTWALEFTFFPLVYNSWLVLDSTSTVSEYAGISFNGSNQLTYADSLGTVVAPLATGITGWNHCLIVWDTANLHTYINGVAVSNVARAGILYPNNSNEQLNINFGGQNHVMHPAWYRNFPTTGVDWAGVAKQHYENQFLNYQQIFPLQTSGSIASGQGWATVLNRDIAPGIPDDIALSISNTNGLWFVEMSAEIER
jgi:hypothetical protein